MSRADKFGSHLEQLRTVALSSRWVVTSGHRHEAVLDATKVHFYDLKGKPLGQVVVGKEITALAALSSEQAVAGSADGTVMLLDVDKVSMTGQLGAASVTALAVSPNGAHIAATTTTGHAFVLDASTLEVEHDLELSLRALRAVAFVDDSTLVVGGDDGVARAAAWRGDRVVREMPLGDHDGIRSVAITPDGRIAAGCVDGSIQMAFLQGAIDPEDRSGDHGHDGAVTGLVVGPALEDDNGQPLPRMLFSTSLDGDVKRWSIDTRRRPARYEGSQRIHGLAWRAASGRAKDDRAGGMLAWVSDDRRLLLQRLDRSSTPSDAVLVQSELARLEGELNARALEARAGAVEAAAAIVEDEARLLLDRALREDRHESVRAQAAALIGGTARRKSAPALRAALGDNFPAVRRAALDALLTLLADTPVDALGSALAHGKSDVRIVAVQQLPAHRQRSPKVIGLIAHALSDDDRKVRTAALDALLSLANHDDPLGPYQIAIHRGPAEVRREALVRMARAGMTSRAEAMLEDALEDEEPGVRMAAFELLVLTRPALAQALSRREPSYAKRHIELLGRRAAADGPATDTASLEPVFAALSSRSVDVAVAASHVLAKLGDVRAVGALLQLSRETSSEVRVEVVEALCDAALTTLDARAVSRLEWLLDDEDASVRIASLDALVHLAQRRGPAARLELARRSLRSSAGDIRRKATQQLVAFGPGGRDAAHGPPLETLDALLRTCLDDEDGTVRFEALRVLWSWHDKEPEQVLRWSVASTQADIRLEAAETVGKRYRGETWAEPLLLELCRDAFEQVGSAAYGVLIKDDRHKKKADYHLTAMASPRPQVRQAAARGCRRAEREQALLERLRELVDDEYPEVQVAAIEAIDAMWPDDRDGFERAFGSIDYALRIRAGELCGHRRDARAVGPMTELLRIPATHMNRPADELRQRAARALADVGHAPSVPFLVELLEEEDPIVREMGARGLMNACMPGHEQPLVDALAHADLAVRSWAAEGLARLGDARALPVLIGTLTHEHHPLRQGAVLGLAALGPDGIRGLLRGLEDEHRSFQELALAIIVARDVAMAQAKLPPDLLVSALSARAPDIRYAAARALERRHEQGGSQSLARALVAPESEDAKKPWWPKKDEADKLIQRLVRLLSSDHPYKRYAAARVLSLRDKSKAYWREARRLVDPAAAHTPFTNWAEEHDRDDPSDEQTPTKQSLRRAADEEAGPTTLTPIRRPWLTPLSFSQTDTIALEGTERVLDAVRHAGAARPRALSTRAAAMEELVFGVYVGLVRQAPVQGESDETHRVRRDAIARLGALAGHQAIGGAAVLPILRKALSDPHHLCRKAALSQLEALYGESSLVPLELALQSDAADIGRQGVLGLVEAVAQERAKAAEVTRQLLDATSSEVRRYALSQLRHLFDEGSLEPWLIALSSAHPDVRLAVVDRLADAPYDQVGPALMRAMESDHLDLRLAAAEQLVRRGQAAAVEVLVSAMQGDHAARVQSRLLRAVLDAKDREPVAQAAARRLAALLEDEEQPAETTIDALRKLRHVAAAEPLMALLERDDAALVNRAFDALLQIARRPESRPASTAPVRHLYHEPLALEVLERGATHPIESLRLSSAQALAHIDDPACEPLLEKLARDRATEVRVAAAKSITLRLEGLPSANTAVASALLDEGRRELVLPAATGLAARQDRKALVSLLLVFHAGESHERELALAALARLGDPRALDTLLGLVDPEGELDEADAPLVPAAVEALAALAPNLEEERERVQKTLDDLMQTGSEEVQRRLMTGMKRAGDEASRARLENIATSELRSPALHEHALQLLGQLGRAQSEGVITPFLSSRHAHLRVAAREALAKLFPNDPTRVDMHALRSRYADVRGPAALRLATAGAPEALLSQLSEIPEASIRRRLRLGIVRRKEVPLAPLAALLLDASDGVRADAAWMLGAAHKPEALPPEVSKALTQALDQAGSRWDEARARSRAGGGLRAAEQAWRALLWAASQWGADATGAAASAVRHRSAPVDVKLEAVKLLKAARELALAFEDRDPEVRRAALDASEDAPPVPLDDQVAAATYAAPATAWDDDHRGGAVLATVRSEDRVDALTARLGSSAAKDATDRMVAIAALGRLLDPKAKVALQALLDDDAESEAVRRAAFKAVRRLERGLARKARQAEADKAGPVIARQRGAIPAVSDAAALPPELEDEP